MFLPLLIGAAAFAALRARNSGTPTALASTSVNTPLIGTGSSQNNAPSVPANKGIGGAGSGTNLTPIEILQLPPEVSAGRYATPVTPYFPAGFSGALSPVSSLPMTPSGSTKPSGVQMTGTVGAPLQGIFMEGPVYTQRSTPSTPVGAYTMGEVTRPASLDTGNVSPTSSLPLVDPSLTVPLPTTVQQGGITAS